MAFIETPLGGGVAPAITLDVHFRVYLNCAATQIAISKNAKYVLLFFDEDSLAMGIRFVKSRSVNSRKLTFINRSGIISCKIFFTIHKIKTCQYKLPLTYDDNLDLYVAEVAQERS